MDIEQKLTSKMPEKAKAVYQVMRPKYANENGSITVGKIVTLVIVCIVIAYILPTGLTALGAINTTGMSDGEIALIQVIGLIVVLVIFAAIAKEAE